MNESIQKWYSEILISFCAGEFSDYKEARDLLTEHLIQSFKLSVNELLVCNEMSVSSLIKLSQIIAKKWDIFSHEEKTSDT